VEKERNTYIILLGKHSLARAKSTWENIKMDLREIGNGNGMWIELGHDRVQWQILVLAVLNILIVLTEDLLICYYSVVFVILRLYVFFTFLLC
jgi:hypothetical protein